MERFAPVWNLHVWKYRRSCLLSHSYEIIGPLNLLESVLEKRKR